MEAKRVVEDRPHILQHDNMRAHSSLQVLQFLVGRAISAMDHPPYSPDLTPADFGCLQNSKSVLKEKRFTATDIKSSVKKMLTDIPVQNFKNYFEQWPTHWQHCKELEGDYFEVANICSY
jgi:histone-lysine N-methyltransferase SETMAR